MRCTAHEVAVWSRFIVPRKRRRASPRLPIKVNALTLRSDATLPNGLKRRSAPYFKSRKAVFQYQGIDGQGRKLRRRQFIAGLGGAAAWSLAARSQPAIKIKRVGYISGTGDASDPGPYVAALQSGLRDLGYVEGKDVSIEYRGAGGKYELIPKLVNELVKLKVDVLVAPISPAVRAAQLATRTIPVVMVTSADPIAEGFVESLARPGGNITGLATLKFDLGGKRLELLEQMVPGMRRVAILRHADDPVTAVSLKYYETAALALKLEIEHVDARGPDLDLESLFQAAARGGANALITITSALLFAYRKQIAAKATNNRLPSMFEGRDWVEAGGLMSYASDDVAVFYRAAYYVDKILKGANPADLPVEQPTKFKLAINTKTAKTMSLTVPTGLLVSADEIIE